MDPTAVYYGRSSYQRDSRLNNSPEKINRAGRRKGYKNKTRSTNKKKLNLRDRTGNITVCFNCGCRFHWSYDCPYGHSSRNKDGVEIEEDLSVSHVVLMSQQKHKNGGDFFLGETLGSAVQDSGESSTVCGTKWYKCFLETLTDAQKKKTSGSNSGISKKSLYKPAPKERIKVKLTNRKPLAQCQLVDLNKPTSAKICKNGMKSLPTLECNFLSPDVQRRETIYSPGKGSISCR